MAKKSADTWLIWFFNSMYDRQYTMCQECPPFNYLPHRQMHITLDSLVAVTF